MPQTTCTVANSLKVTRLGSSGAVAGDGEPFVVLMTGLSGCRGLAASRPAEVANSRNFCDKPLCCLLDVVAAITCGS